MKISPLLFTLFLCSSIAAQAADNNPYKERTPKVRHPSLSQEEIENYWLTRNASEEVRTQSALWGHTNKEVTEFLLKLSETPYTRHLNRTRRNTPRPARRKRPAQKRTTQTKKNKSKDRTWAVVAANKDSLSFDSL